MANYHDIFQKGQDDIVPLAMQAMKLKMEQEQFEMVKNEKLRQIKGEEDFRRYVEEKSKPITEKVTLPDIAPTTFQSQSFSNLPPMQLSSGLSGLTTTIEKPAPPLNPDELLKKAVQFGIMPANNYLTLLQGKDDIINIPAGGTAFSKSKGVPVFTAPKTLPEVNVANELDTILGGMFPNYYTDPKAREDALAYYTQHPQEIQAKVAEFAKAKAPPQFTVVPTTNGLVPFQTKGEGAGDFQPTPDGGGQPTYYKPMPAEATAKMGVLQSLKNDIKKVQELYQPEYVGPVMGRAYGLQENLPEAIVGAMPEQQAIFMALTRNLQDAELRKRSGAQINEQEMKRLIRFLPDPKLPPNVFMSRVKLFEYELDNIIGENADIYGSQGYDVSSFTKDVKKVDKPVTAPQKRKKGETVQEYLKRTGGL